ncbi:MAG: hypothetical protein A3A58_01580 [Candidatus Blackburnbacteria bacterium RIFCSPLOWO2_01_FULL_41_27]|uniref:Uncharacterized protein n=2 Tax=Candidatus Blackburniibacteriota TaxID=1817898 RepID=A0A1G1V5Q3_9BACT|nr:MAG: hypothetical protein A3F61_02285 [Candidatus Blackburnbacteria bacterium RIFCSPHIGHO2_12_FULL_41_13b]OGY14338.1 MAG: hypothetical protein A3A58_01580 [Candidatus Blackburnbacteria bacterium RIFCSPLOWO2_01_FULL_41_27]
MNYDKKSKVSSLNIDPNYDPAQIIKIRQFGVNDLERYLQKIDKNIKIFKEAITKEVTEKTRVRTMIKDLKTDIKNARDFKKNRRTKNI